MATPIIAENWSDALDVSVKTYYANKYREIDSVISFMANVKDSDRPTESSSEAGAHTGLAEWTGKIHYGTRVEGYKNTYTHKQYSGGLEIEYWAYINDQHSVMEDSPKTLAIETRRFREEHFHSIFNNAFSSTRTGGDTLSLCSTAHTTKGQGSDQSNSGTTAISVGEVLVVRNLMIDYKNDNGKRIGMNPDTIIVKKGTTAEATGFEIIESGGKVDVSTNNANFHKGRYKLITMDYLSDSNNWFMADWEYMQQWLIWWDRVPVMFFKDTQIDTLVARFACYMAFSYGWDDWRWVYGENPA